MDEQYVVYIGDAFNGATLYGPFDDAEEATQWAEANEQDSDWHVVKLINPNN